MTLLGGEPLLKKGIFKIIDRLIKNNIRVTISTNGHMSDRILQEVIARKNYFDTFQFSIHSLDNDRHRYLTNSKSSVEHILANAKVLIEADMNVTARTVVNRFNQAESRNIYRRISSLGFKSYYLSPVIFKGRADLNKTQLELSDAEWYKHVLTVGLSSKENRICNVHIIDKPLVADFIEKNFQISITRRSFCDGGFVYFCVAPNGKAYPCPPLFDKINFTPGNIRTLTIEAIWNSTEFANFRQRHYDFLLNSTGERFGCQACLYFRAKQCIPCPFEYKTNCYQKIDILEQIKAHEK